MGTQQMRTGNYGRSTLDLFEVNGGSAIRTSHAIQCNIIKIRVRVNTWVH